MARKYPNDKDFLIIEMDCLEASMECNFGINTGHLAKTIVCDNCNNTVDPFEDVYYFAVLNRALCKECCEDIIKNLDKHPEDSEYEKAHYNHYARILKLEQV